MKKRTSKFRTQVANNSHRQKTQGSQYGYLNLPRGVNIYSEKPDTRVRLDLLPYTVTDERHPDRNTDNGAAMVGEPWYKRPFKLHRNVGVNNEACVCPTSIGKPCPICNHRSGLRREGGDAETIKALRPSDRNLYVVIPRGIDKGKEEYEEKPHVWDISQFCFQDMLNDEIDENDDHAVFPDPEEGLTLRIRFSEESFAKNKFAKTNRIDFLPREYQISEEVLKLVPNLDNVLSILSYKELENKFLEIDQESEGGKVKSDEGEDDEKTGERTEKVSPKPAAKDEDDEADEKVDTPKRPKTIAYDDEDKEETPAPKRRPAPAEEDDEEDTPAPKRKKPSDEDACVACQGTGENSKGKTCPICKGTGKRTLKTESSPAPEKKEPTNGKCPYKHRFGVDCEQFNECDECEIWDACYEAKEARK